MAKVKCLSCPFSERIEPPTADFPRYCPDCGTRTTVEIKTTQPEKTKTDKV